jgi:SAM-dependent methyltransferase
MEDALEKLKQTWQTLGRDDQLWAIVSLEGKRGGKWDADEFFATGERDVEHFHGILQARAGGPARLGPVLDFGCGVGRLSLAWAKRAREVVGVDISRPMVERGRAMLASVPNLTLVVNEAADLACFESNRFELVFSHVCLQHIPWNFAAAYLREFARICAPGGWVMFDLPARNLSATWGPRLRQRIVEGLPFSLGTVYRRWKHGSEAVFDMHYTAAEKVQQTLSGAGLRLVHREADHSAGEKAEGYLYIFRKN